MSLLRAERLAIIEALRFADGNITRAAGLLAVHRRSLQRKLKKHGLDHHGSPR